MSRNLLVLLTIIISSCGNIKTENVSVDFNDTITSELQNNDGESKAVYIAIASMISPKETYIYYISPFFFILLCFS